MPALQDPCPVPSPRPWWQPLRLLALTTALLGSWGAGIGQAQTAPVPPEQLIFQTLLELPSLYDLGTPFGGNNGSLSSNGPWPTVTATEPSPVAQTLPSLWWNRDQIISRWGSYRLVDDWVAFHSTTTVEGTGIEGLKVVDVRVDRQYWDGLHDRTLRLDARQYSLLNQWGTTASSYGYHLRLYRSGRIVGIYTCDFSRQPALTTPPVSEVPLDRLDNLDCFARVGPFVTRPTPPDETLFTPP
jgi:hypothetical protein